MKVISHYQIHGVPGAVTRADFDGRLVDFWSPKNPTHLLVAHDGQNVFDPRTATNRFTWRMAQNAIKVFEQAGLTPPAIIGVFHSSNKLDPNGRFKDLTPQNAFQNSVKPLVQSELKPEHLHGNAYHQNIAENIVPAVADCLNFSPTFENSAMIGSSMGGLATINALSLRKDFFATALAFSPHWVIGGHPLVDHLLLDLPTPGNHKIWMSRGDRKLDSTYKHDQDYADDLMRQLGWGTNFKSSVYKGATHNERAWAKQVSDALRFWLFDYL
jgi:predicted alpha/beta superfamily hydrolase